MQCVEHHTEIQGRRRSTHRQVYPKKSKMKLMFRPLLFHLLLCSATQTLGVTIQSDPGASSEGVVQTELEKAVSLVCQPSDDHEAPDEEELVWLRNDAVVSLKEENIKGRSSVCVTPVIHEDNGATFTCYTRSNSTVRTSVILNVTYAPDISGSQKVTVEQEAVLELQCDVWANPPVSSLSWTLNGSIVDLSASSVWLTNDGFKSKLSANMVERSLHEGTYECIAISMYGEHRKSFSVTVTEKTMKFPLMPIIAGVVVAVLTAILAAASRWKRIVACCRK